MNKQAGFSMWVPSGPARWDQPARQTPLAGSPLGADLCGDPFARPTPAATRVGRPVDGGRLPRSPTGRYGVARPPPLLPECSAFRSRLFDGTSLAHRTGVLAVMDAARFPVVSVAPELAADPAPLQPVCATLAHHG